MVEIIRTVIIRRPKRLSAKSKMVLIPYHKKKMNHESKKFKKHEIFKILLRQLNTRGLSFPRRRESRKRLDAGSRPA
jgi:hypothetical protein